MSFSLVGGGLVTKLCPTLCYPMDCSLLGFSVHGISQAGILEWVAIVPMCSGKQTHSEGQCRECSALYYTCGPKAESPLSQGP